METKRARSPRYPRFGLRQAVERVKQVYREESTHAAPKNVIAQDMGFGGLNGASNKVIGTLKGYALLQDQGKDSMSVTGDAMTIIELPKGDPKRAEAVSRTAFSPPLFAELQSSYPNGLRSDANVRHFLISTKGFLPQAVDAVIRVYRENLELVAEEASEYPEVDRDSEDQRVVEPMSEAVVEQEVVAPTPDVPAPRMDAPAPERGSEVVPPKVFRFATSEDSEAVIEWVGPVTRDSFETLIGILQAQKLAYPERKRPAIERPAEQTAIEMPPPE